jgi:hypothetical protein
MHSFHFTALNFPLFGILSFFGAVITTFLFTLRSKVIPRFISYVALLLTLLSCTYTGIFLNRHFLHEDFVTLSFQSTIAKDRVVILESNKWSQELKDFDQIPASQGGFAGATEAEIADRLSDYIDSARRRHAYLEASRAESRIAMDSSL